MTAVDAGRTGSRPGRTLLYVVLVGLTMTTAAVGAWLLVSAASSSNSGIGRSAPDDQAAQARLQAQAGVNVLRVAVTGGGGLVDLRYRVVDTDKAAAVHRRDKPPAIVDEKTGKVIEDLFMDHQHRGRLHAGQSYYLIFVNSKGLIKPGGRVSVLLGGARLSHLTVR